MDKHQVAPEAAHRVLHWLRTRGGIAVWDSVNLSNPGASWTTPALQEDGTPYTKPSWQASNTPRIITDPDMVEVVIDKEVKRFRVAVRRATSGMITNVTDAGSKRIRKEMQEAGKDATYRFDYRTQEAVIFVPERVVPIVEYVKYTVE